MMNINIIDRTDIVSSSRAINRPGEYAILPRENRCYSFLPDWNLTYVDVLTSPDRGSKFIQMELVIQPKGGTELLINENFQQFFFVLDGEIRINLDDSAYDLKKNCYIWLPPNDKYSISNLTKHNCRVVWVRKLYIKHSRFDVPDRFIENETNIPLIPVDTHFERNLLPVEDKSFDICLKTIYFDPGAYFSFVESHVQEHGIIMLQGSGLYYLNGTYHEVQKGDFIFMAPWCLQFMYGTGMERSGYLLYKDWNRDYF